jgi:hypothetical protein
MRHTRNSVRGWMVALTATGCMATSYKREDLLTTQSMDWWRRALRVENGLVPYNMTVRLVWIGDSTTRNQLSFLCDVLRGVPGYSRHYGGCAGPDFEIISSGLQLGGMSPPWDMRTAGVVLDQLPPPRSSALPLLPDRPTLNVTYFGSTLMHAMQLLPARRYLGRAGLDLSSDLSSSVSQMRARGWCPIFHTVNWVCEQKLCGAYTSAHECARAAGDGAQYFLPLCRAELKARNRSADARLCASLSLGSNGSDAAAAMERSALRLVTPPIAVVDAHATTRNQCWATALCDGRHYTPLLPQRVASLLAAIRECASELSGRTGAGRGVGSGVEGGWDPPRREEHQQGERAHGDQVVRNSRGKGGLKIPAAIRQGRISSIRASSW